jgi:HEAT repeat protein
VVTTHRALAAVGLTVVVFLSAMDVVRGDETVYQGRTVSSWLQDFAYGRFPDMAKHRAAEDAIRKIGIEAIPILVEQLKTDTDAFHETASEMRRLSEKKDYDGASTVQVLDAIRDDQTVHALKVLGPEVKSAIPTLIPLLAPAYDAARAELQEEPTVRLKDQKSEATARALAAIGDEAVPLLIDTLQAEDVKLRFGAAMALQYFYHWDGQTIPALIEALDDPDSDVRWRAARTLGSRRAMPEVCVPALAERLRNDPSSAVRNYALGALRKFGPKAKAAVPDIIAASADPGRVVQSNARKALVEILAEESQQD